MILWVVAAVVLLLIIAAIVMTVISFADRSERPEIQLPSQTEQPTEPLPFDIPGFTRIDDAEIARSWTQLEVTAVGRYSGAYVEDGTDEEVTDVLALIVRNTGDTWLEYAELTLDCGGKTGTFGVSALPAGSSALLMEKNRLTYQQGTSYRITDSPKCTELTSAVIDFSEDFELYPDDGVINIKNISGKDISSDVCVIYKNYAYGLYTGGICYRARAQGGIAAEDIFQSIQPHFSNENSVILFMTYEN